MAAIWLGIVNALVRPVVVLLTLPVTLLSLGGFLLVVNAYNEVRHIYIGRDFPDELDMWPSVYGTSIGHWEGDTLVVETVMVTTPNDYFQGAPVFSDEAHYLERIRMTGDRLESEVTVTDPVTLTAPFTAHVSYVRELGFDRMIQIDWDNDRTGVDENGFNTIEEEAVQ